MVGIIGYGRFGELAARYLVRDVDVVVFDSGGKSARIEAVGAQPADLKITCAQEMVLLCVPISHMQTQLKTIAPLLKPGTVVIDVCSVKVYPVKWMTELLPAEVEILPTHPMFGPDSAAESLDGRKMVLCNVTTRLALYRRIYDYLQGKGLEVIEATPEEHDRQIAVSLSLTHFIGRSLAEFGAEKFFNGFLAGQLFQVFQIAERADLFLVVGHQDDADDDEGAHRRGEQVDRRQRVDFVHAAPRSHRDTPTKSPLFWRASVCRKVTRPRFWV